MTPAGAEGLVTHHGPRDRPQFALTYDDGPGAGTESLLGLLAERGTAATFFFVGSQVERDAGLARTVVESGHEVGSHTMEHLDHREVGPERAVADMVDGAASIERVLGVVPKLYRAPYGAFVRATVDGARERGWTCVAWSVSGEDWRERETGDSVARRVLGGLVPGAIVLLHDGRRAKPTGCAPMLHGTEAVLVEAERRGLRPVTVSRLTAPTT